MLRLLTQAALYPVLPGKCASGESDGRLEMSECYIQEAFVKTDVLLGDAKAPGSIE